MFRLFRRVFSWFQDKTLKLLFLAGALLVIWGTLAPVGTLFWWISQDSKSFSGKKNRFKNLPSSEAPDSATNSSATIDCYIVFLTGVGDYSANQLAPGEEVFVDRLVKKHPNCVAVRDVFPYSAANKSLGDDRLLAPLWRFAQEADGWLENVDALIKIRNLWRFAISIDDRYGPVYNRGIARAVIERMNAAHSIPRSSSHPLKLILIGTSGGAQIALGASDYLDRWLEAQLIVISVGGDFSGSDGFNAVEHVYHLKGKKDWITNLSGMIFPSRWYWTISSPFNRAKQQGRYTVYISGPHAHEGAKGYFGQRNVPGKNYTYLDLTLPIVNRLPIWSNSETNQNNKTFNRIFDHSRYQIKSKKRFL